MNHLKNKRIRSVADLLQDQFGLALGRLQHAVQKTIRRVFIRQSKPTPGLNCKYIKDRINSILNCNKQARSLK